MKAPNEIREQAEILLELSNSILSAAIGGYWDEMDMLERQRTSLFERMLGVEGVTAEDRLFLAGVMEHIRVVDATTRKFLGSEQGGEWMLSAGSGQDALSGEEFAFLGEPPPREAGRRPAAYQ